MPNSQPIEKQLRRERLGLLRRLSHMLDVPMTLLAFVWLILLVVEFTVGFSPTLDTINLAIWALFVLHFALELWIAPDKLRYLRKNWLTAVALLLPAVRVLRVFRTFRLLRTVQAARGVRLVRWITSLNRGMKATQQAVRQRGLTYVVALTIIVNFAGAAGVYYFENPQALRESGLATENDPATGIRTYGEAVWWTAMMLTTMGSDYFPKSSEGRLITWLLAVHAFAIFGYITATVASFIIRVDRDDGSQVDFAALRDEIRQMRLELERLKLS